jgi:biotin carboxyl carrier protein
MNDQHYPTDADHTNLLTLDTIRELVHLVNQANISELLIERDGLRLHIKREHTPVASAIPATSAMSAPRAAQPPAPGTPPDTSATLSNTPLPTPQQSHTPDNDYVLKAPLVGVFQRLFEKGQSGANRRIITRIMAM